jgi:hypothetical protein
MAVEESVVFAAIADYNVRECSKTIRIATGNRIFVL